MTHPNPFRGSNRTKPIRTEDAVRPEGVPAPPIAHRLVQLINTSRQGPIHLDALPEVVMAAAAGWNLSVHRANGQERGPAANPERIPPSLMARINAFAEVKARLFPDDRRLIAKAKVVTLANGRPDIVVLAAPPRR
jgi:hypothetical protein